MVTTIQQTSKPIKLTIAIGAIIFWVALVTAIAAETQSTTDSAIMWTIIGMLVYLVGRVLKWWKHH